MVHEMFPAAQLSNSVLYSSTKVQDKFYTNTGRRSNINTTFCYRACCPPYLQGGTWQLSDADEDDNEDAKPYKEQADVARDKTNTYPMSCATCDTEFKIKTTLQTWAYLVVYISGLCLPS